MFIEKYVDTITRSETPNEVALAFLPSINVQAYPCGRRRSEEIDGSNRIPFDPEARLNTEANNRKHSGINGYTQTYLHKWDEDNKHLSLALGGYLFDIQLSDAYKEPNAFGEKLIETLSGMAQGFIDDAADDTEAKEKAESLKAEIETAEYIYANIVVEDVNLFVGFHTYQTGILRNQSGISIGVPEGSLDLLIDTDPPADKTDKTKYYFSGLSFSTEAFTTATSHEEPISFNRDIGGTVPVKVNQTLISLRVLKKNGTTWELYQPSLLPSVAHGDTADSVKVGDLYVKDITATGNISAANISAEGTIEAATITTDGYNPPTEVEEGALTFPANADLNANDVNITGTATISNLVVDTQTIGDNIKVNGAVEADNVTVTSAGKMLAHTAEVLATLDVKNNDKGAVANIDIANITSELNVENYNAEADTATANIDWAAIAKADINEANIETLNSTEAIITTVTSETIEGTTLVKGAELQQNGCPVPTIELVSCDSDYQLQITLGPKQAAEPSV